MSDATSKSSPRTAGKVRWRRFAIAAVPAIAVAGTLVGLTAQGAIASSISVSGKAFTITASQLSGTGFEQFGGVVTDSSGTQHPVMVSAIQNANLTNLCQSVSVFGITLRLTAGDAGTPANAQNLIVDADTQTGSSATFTNITIGQDAGTLTEDPGVTGPATTFGEQADGVTIDNLRQDTWLTTAGTFTLPDLNLGFGQGC
jgi:hypothetical protein